MRVPERIVVVVVGLAALAGCGQDQAFRVDKRVTITAPIDRAEVRLPVTLSWRTERLGQGSFGVFIDRAPVRPGKPVVESVSRTGAVYKTSETKLVVREVQRDQDDGRERHTATIVLLDASGRRVGESAWDVVFEVKRDAER